MANGDASADEHAGHEPPSRPQFGLTALLWSTAVIALALAYLRRFDSPEVFANAFFVTLIACLFGAVVGWPARRAAESTYWSVVITTAAYLSVVGDLSYGVQFHFAWSAVGTISGACGGAIAPQRPLLRILCCGVAAGVMMLLYVPSWGRQGPELTFDLISAPIVGALVGLLIELILWIERQRRIPRYVTASWLLLAVIAGNFMVPWVLN